MKGDGVDAKEAMAKDKTAVPALLADVAVADATIYYDKLYTYRVPAELGGHIFVGSMVLVPFGFGRAKPRIGVVVQLGEDVPPPRVKDVWDVAPRQARLTDELLAIVKYLKEATFCTWFEAVKAVVPRGAQYRVERDGEGYRLRPRLERVSETVYTLAETAEGQDEPRLTEKQRRVLDFVKDGAKTKAEIAAGCQVGTGVAAGLAKKGLLLEDKRDRDPEEDVGDALMPVPKGGRGGSVGADGGQVFTLSPAQQQVVDGLKQQMAQPRPKPALLYGVTGSGKTPVFMALIREALDAGKTALVLVPEIGLTPQMLGAMKAAFGSWVAVQHSGLSATQRLLQWRSIQRGEARVVVGTRSAVFAPLENIGIIVVDEEQERTYQSESAPRYDAIEVARRRAAHHGALLLLASATPSVASYYLAVERDWYQLYTLKERYGNLPLPAVEMVDMAEEMMAGNTGALSGRLCQAMEKTIAAGRQVILLLNRRGYHRVALCRSCGKAVKCGECSVPMVYHRPGGQGAGRLVCHYCGRSQDPAPEVCPECGGALRYQGFGTQRLEEELAERLPAARVLRMDMDTTTKKGAHAGMLARFGRGEADILLGTQMVAKGLDFENVSLVGVVGIDSLLFGQGYRAYETVFSLVTQVVGRSGRAGRPGQAIIQTVDADNPVLRMAAKQDYDAFYREEAGYRRVMMYPPYCALCLVGFAAESEADAMMAAQSFARLLVRRAKEQEDPGKVPLKVLGPAPMPVVQVGGSFRWRLTVKCRGDAAFRKLAREVLEDYNGEGWPKKATAWLDFHTDG